MWFWTSDPTAVESLLETRGRPASPAIPSSFRGQEVPITLDAEGFEAAAPNQKYRLDRSDIYLLVHRRSGLVSGMVQDDKNQPIVGAAITIGTNTITSGASGHFDFVIAGEQLKSELRMQVTAPGFKLFREFVVANANETTITLQRDP
jgi:hypothetical protein